MTGRKTAICTLVFPERGGKVLLGLGTCGVNLDKRNGFGGKLEPGERLPRRAVIELREEAGLVAQEEMLHKVGIMTFHWTREIPGLGIAGARDVQVHIYRLFEWQEDPGWDPNAPDCPMKDLCWYSKTDLPWKEMHDGERYWLTMALNGQLFIGELSYDEKAWAFSPNVRPATSTELGE